MKQFITLCVALCVNALFAVITIDPASRTFAKDGGGGAILTSGSGTWDASTTADWIQITPRTSGDAGVSCVYIVSANLTADVRTGEILIGGNVHTVTQTGYSATIKPMSAVFALEGGEGTVNVVADAGVSWTAKSNVPWIEVSPESGLSTGTVFFTVDKNTEVLERSGSMTIAGKTFMVTQTGTDVLLTPKETYRGSGAEIVQVKVTALATTKWSVTVNNSWISVIDSGNGFGDDHILLAIGANPSAARRYGSITVGSKTMTIIQEGKTAVALDLLPKQATADAIGAFGNIAVLATPDLKWTAESLSPWITLSTGETGYGNGNIGYVASANPTLETREGQVKVTAVMPYPVIEIVRGLSCWKGTNYNGGVVFNAANVADTTVAGRTSGILFSVKQENALHRIAGLNGDEGAVYVNTDNVLVAHEGDTVSELIPIATNVTYELFVVHDGAKTRYYVREKDAGDVQAFDAHYEKAYDVTSVGKSEVPSSGALVHGTAISYYYWYRDVSERELNYLDELNLSVEHNDDDVYKDLYEHVSGETLVADRKVCVTNIVVSNSFVRTLDRNGHSLGAIRAASSEDVALNVCSNLTFELDAKYELIKRGAVSNLIYLYFYKFLRPTVTRERSSLNVWCKVDSFKENLLMDWNWTLSRYDYSSCSNYSSSSSSKYVSLYEYRLDKVSIIESYDLGISINCDKGLTIDGHTFGNGLLADGWHMITTTFSDLDDDTMTVYIDGKEVGNFVVTSNALEAIRIPDSWRVYASAVNGTAIDEISYFTNCLTSAQVAKIYELEKPKNAVIHTVVQGAVTPFVSTNRFDFEAVGGSDEVDVTVAQNVNWTVENESDWITITSTGDYAGSRTVMFDVGVNSSVTQRVGTLKLAGNEVKVYQNGLRVTVTHDDLLLPVDGGVKYIDVHPEGNASWEAVSDVSWITIVSGEAGLGEGSVMIVMDPCTSTSQSRTGTITVAGKKVYVTQRGYTLSIFPEIAQIGSNSGAGEVGVSAPIDVVWEAIATMPWITITGSRNGVGNGTLYYTVAANTTGATRTGKIIVSGTEYTITQLSSLLVKTETDGHGSVTGGGAYETGAEATLTATPKAGYVFSHWTGDMVGYSNPVKFTVDIGKTVKANFIPKDAATTIVNASALEQGFFTRDQMKDLALGQPTIEQDASGDFTLAIGLEECTSLENAEWKAVKPANDSVTITPEGHVRFKVRPDGSKTKFFKMVHRHENP